MKLLMRDRVEAQLLPSRHHFALFRLVAYVRLRNAAPTMKPGLYLGLDRDQTAGEIHTISVLILALSTCFIGTALTSFLAVPLSIVIAPVAAMVTIQLVMIVVGVSSTRLRSAFGDPAASDNRALNSVCLWSLLTAAALYFASRPSPARWVAAAFLVVLGANGTAAVILWLMRRRVAAVERAYIAT